MGRHIIREEYPSFDKISFVFQYHPSLSHLQIPVSQRDAMTMLAMAQKHGATECIFYLKFSDLNFEMELAMNGEPWTLSMIESMDANMRAEYARLDMKFVENKWSMRPIRLLLEIYFMSGHC